MSIRKAIKTAILQLFDLLSQILLVHHQARPDIFKEKGRKYNEQDLEKLMTQEHTPIFIYEDTDGQILGHLFVTIKEESENPVLRPIKTLFIEDLCVNQAARGQKIGDQLYQFAISYAKEIGCYNLTLILNENQRAN